MFRQGSALTDAERRAVAAFLAGRPVGTAGASVERRSLHGERSGHHDSRSDEWLERVGRGRVEHALSSRPRKPA